MSVFFKYFILGWADRPSTHLNSGRMVNLVQGQLKEKSSKCNCFLALQISFDLQIFVAHSFLLSIFTVV